MNERIYWLRVDEKSIRVKKKCTVFKNIRIRVDGT